MRRKLPGVLGSYANRPVARFHMPGHKGRGMTGFFSSELIGWDITELSFSDNLHCPSDSILEAQTECAKAYGAEHSYFLVNGSTGGIHSLMAYLSSGAKVLSSRDCHRSVINGALLFGHDCDFIMPEYIEEHDLYGCVSAKSLDSALCSRPADAVFITSPNYYGLCADIPALSAIAHKHGALLFVDAAHGAHFPFSNELPPSPAGFADAWVNSAHKTLNALGQSAYLHAGKGMDYDRLQRSLTMVQTSSPSYLLMASLDWARYTASLPNTWTRTVKRCRSLKSDINTILGLKTLRRELIGTAGIADMDDTRVVIDVSERGITGFEAQASLERNDVFIETSDFKRIACICTPADDPIWYVKLKEALERLPYGMPRTYLHTPPYSNGERAMPAGEAIRAKTQQVPFVSACGHIAADSAGPYPPGIPLWMPGERITPEQTEYLQSQLELGASLFGVRSGRVQVVEERE